MITAQQLHQLIREMDPGGYINDCQSNPIFDSEGEETERRSTIIDVEIDLDLLADKINQLIKKD